MSSFHPTIHSVPFVRNRLFHYILGGFLVLFVLVTTLNVTFSTLVIFTAVHTDYRRRPECQCSRPALPSFATSKNDNRSSLCSLYATHRGPNQRIIAISLFGPKENPMFQFNRTLRFLHELIADLDRIYSDRFILRIYHDMTVNMADVICPIECRHDNVDFCSTDQLPFIPPKIWRFLPVGDPLVDVMMSRDLDSAFTARERSAVDEWLTSNRSFHAMRDHPLHGVPMLGGMWGFRPSTDAAVARTLLATIHDRNLIRKYGGRGDQDFLAAHVWPLAKRSVIVHDSFLCRNGFGHGSQPFPTQRRPANETNCFVGCVRPCCGKGKLPFGPCPPACRPTAHPEWLYC